MLLQKENRMAEQKCRECGHGNATAALFCERCGRALHAQERDPLVGKTIAERYHLLECIGAGGAGVLYRAEHVTLRRRIALKLLHKHLATSDDAVERFRREAITVCEIDNEHIPQVFDFGRSDDSRLFFAMEFLEGETLAQAIAKAPQGQFSVERVVDILAQIADGLVDAHTLGYVHRDLRPRSIFLTKRRSRSDFVKLLDFGLAKLVQPDVDAQRTAMGMTYGDPRYMAPEQARGEAVDRRADIYSLGAIGFELLTGQPPYVGSGPFEILGKVLDAPVPRVRDRRSDCPAWLESVIRMALHKSAADRFQTVTQLLDALERKQVLLGVPALPGAGRVAVPAAATPLASAAKAPQSTLAMPTVAPPAGAASAGRSTMSYPAVKPVRPATFGVSTVPAASPGQGTGASPAAPAAASASSGDELRLLAERVPPAAAVSSSQKPVAKAAAQAPSPVMKPATAPVASKPASAVALDAAMAKVAAPAKAVVIKPSVPSRADPTPRTTAARIEQEAAGWLETAQSLFDEGTNPEAHRAVQESADAAEAAGKLLASSGARADLDTGEDVGGDPGENDTILSLSAPTPAVQKAAAKPLEKPGAEAPAAKIGSAAAKPVAKVAPAAASQSAAPVAAATSVSSAPAKVAAVAASRTDTLEKPASSAPERPQPGPVAAPSSPIVVSEARPAATQRLGFVPPPAQAAAPAALAAQSAETVPSVAGETSLAERMTATVAPAATASPSADDDIPESDATLPHIKTEAEPTAAESPAPSEDDTLRHGKLAAPLPTTAPLPRLEPAIEAEHDSTKTPESEPPEHVANAETAWFAKPAQADGFADDDSYTVTRKKPPLWLYIGAAGLALIGGIVWLSGSSKPAGDARSGTPGAPSSVATPTLGGSGAPTGTGTGQPSPGPAASVPTSASGGSAPTPVVVESLSPAGSAAPAASANPPATGSPAPSGQPEASAAEKTAGKAALAPTASPEKSGSATAEAPKGKAESAAPSKAAEKPAEKAAEKPAPAGKDKAEAPGTKLAMASKPASKATADSAEPASKPAAAAGKGKADELAALIKLGKRRLDDGDTDAAAGIFARAVELDGANADALAGLGSARYEQGEYEQAVRPLQKAARLLPRKTSLLEMLADAQFKAKRYKDSADTARKLLKQDPGSAKAKQILERAEKQL